MALASLGTEYRGEPDYWKSPRVIKSPASNGDYQELFMPSTSPTIVGTAGNLNLSPLDIKVEKLSMFDGVFVPVFFSIFGVVLYTRMGWIVGTAGLKGLLAILVFGEAAAIFTTLSICAICTNGTMRGGGAYYMISRTLGPEFGGAVG